MAVEILSPVETRLVEVWRYTKRKWGAAQADKYLRGLSAALKEVDRKRKNSRRFPDDAIRDVFYLRYQPHRIFFREFDDKVIGVITVLHESMDLPVRLRDDLERIDE